MLAHVIHGSFQYLFAFVLFLVEQVPVMNAEIHEPFPQFHLSRIVSQSLLYPKYTQSGTDHKTNIVVVPFLSKVQFALVGQVQCVLLYVDVVHWVFLAYIFYQVVVFVRLCGALL